MTDLESHVSTSVSSPYVPLDPMESSYQGRKGDCEDAPKYSGSTTILPKYTTAVPNNEQIMYACQVVISSATMMSSLITRAVYDIATIWRNSLSNKRDERSMMLLPI